ncbi:NADH-quinone oxidoreductase subunit C [Methanomassiliicoccus luminyensis]|jgi:NADH:ubiquinone oxidoreductase subunit C|uniref:NADH-quinone oxidoreductase subunit C n=1 Tax=Methanomassiliicoccus luminyensis TaxID=1080712 RepID=UPI0009DAAC3C|nr:NADH-quinone oxidoreductase subunit C [Methanomassiliicoccus luminyensis]
MNGHANSQAISQIREMAAQAETRLVTIVASEVGEGELELIYVLDRDGGLEMVRSRSGIDDELESLSPLFLGAENLEREIIDLLGARFEGLEGGFLLMPGGPTAPLRRAPTEG